MTTAKGTNKPKYLPTPEEIRYWCEYFQSQWSEQEEISRRIRCGRHWTDQIPDPMTVPTVQRFKTKRNRENHDD